MRLAITPYGIRRTLHYGITTDVLLSKRSDKSLIFSKYGIFFTTTSLSLLMPWWHLGPRSSQRRSFIKMLTSIFMSSSRLTSFLAGGFSVAVSTMVEKWSSTNLPRPPASAPRRAKVADVALEPTDFRLSENVLKTHI